MYKIFNQCSARYAMDSMICSLQCPMWQKFMCLYTRRKMYTVGGARGEIFYLYKVFIPTIIYIYIYTVFFDR